MKKYKMILSVVSIFVGGILIGGYAGYSSASASKASPSSNEIASDKPTPPIVTDIDNGEGLTPTQMLEQLQKTPTGEDFNKRYINYRLMLRNYETGMARIAKDKSDKPELKTLSEETMDTNQTLAGELLRLQKLWRYSHH